MKTRVTKRNPSRSAERARRKGRATSSGREAPPYFAALLLRAEQRTVWLVTWLAGTIAGMIGWAGLEAGVAPWLGARRAAIVRIVAFVRRS